jgi:hypothetical protein
VVGGRGGDATAAEFGTAGGNGGAGGDGQAARECRTPRCAGEQQAGGEAGVNSSCAGSTGQRGGRVVPTSSTQEYAGGPNGLGGSNSTYSHSNASHASYCKYDCTVPERGVVGGAAQNGSDGHPGTPGQGCSVSIGTIADGDWRSPGGSAGTVGTPGRGGGGGGAGGCALNENPSTCTIGLRVGDLGAAGGGGGAGACGGGSGRGGGGGGASFGILAIGRSPTIEGNFLDLGFGGTGAAGGAGGYGGLGGPGGRGGPNSSIAWCAGQGGPGGRGGNGGAGAGGGGGCGGSVFGVAGTGLDAARIFSKNTFAPTPLNAAGRGGRGGQSPAGAAAGGTAGQAGVVAELQAF